LKLSRPLSADSKAEFARRCICGNSSINPFIQFESGLICFIRTIYYILGNCSDGFALMSLPALREPCVGILEFHTNVEISLLSDPPWSILLNRLENPLTLPYCLHQVLVYFASDTYQCLQSTAHMACVQILEMALPQSVVKFMYWTMYKIILTFAIW
jgi:hypothetical protein